MCLIFVVFALVVLVSPGEAKSLEEFEVELNILKTKMEETHVFFKEKIESGETDLWEKIGTLEASENKMKKKIENMEASEDIMKTKIEVMESSETYLKNKIENLERNEQNLKENEMNMGKKISELEKKIDNLQMKLETRIENSNYFEKQEGESKYQVGILNKITKTEGEENMFKNNAEEIDYKLGNKEGNNTEERLAYLEELSKLQLRRSCQELAEYGVVMDNFYYVDPDGPLVGSSPIRVWCHFNQDGLAVTEVLHNSEEKIDVAHCHDAGCYVRPILYSAPDFQIQSLIQISESCEQSIEYNCLLTPLEKEGVDLGFWLDKTGARQSYWDGANAGRHVCSCFFTEQGCLDHEVTNNTCNCDAGVPEMKSDVGVITNSSALPVSQLQFGGLSYEIQQASHQLGRLRCWGRAQFEEGTSCAAIKKAGEFRSGYFNVKKSQDENSQLVFCKASSGYDENNEDEVYIESSEDHFQDVETTIGEIDTTIDGIETSIDGIETGIDGMKADISDVGGQVSILEDKMDDVMKRSDYCSYQDYWIDDNTVITFDKLLVDNNYNIPGANMDINKGEFTAGITGIYDVNVSMKMGENAGESNDVYFRVNGVNMAESEMYSGSNDSNVNEMGGRHMKLLLNAGDILSLYGANVLSLRYITFCINLAK